MLFLFSIEKSLTSVAELSVSAPENLQTLEDIDQVERPLTSQSTESSIQTKEHPKTDTIHEENKKDESIKNNIDNQKEFSTKQSTRRSSSEQRSYNHDILVIQTQPPKVIFVFNDFFQIFLYFL